MFKNAIIYRLTCPADLSLQSVEDALQKMPFAECGATQELSMGFVPARGEANGPLLESVGSQWIAKFQTEKKAVPAQTLARRVAEKADRIEQETGRKPGRKETKDLKEEAKLDLLPMAFTKMSSTLAWIDREAGTLVLDTGSQSRADEVVSALMNALPGATVSLLDTQTSPQAAMAHWLTTQEAPVDFSIDRECELKAQDEEKAVVRYSNHALDIEQVKEHIAQGKLPTKLGMSWDGRVSFVLTEGGTLRRLQLLDTVMEGGDQEGGFDADVAIFTGEMRFVLAALANALGGEVPAHAQDADAAQAGDARVNDGIHRIRGILGGMVDRAKAGGYKVEIMGTGGEVLATLGGEK